MSSPPGAPDQGRVLVPSTPEILTQIPPKEPADLSEASPSSSEDENEDEDTDESSDWTHSATSHASRFLRSPSGEHHRNQPEREIN